MGKYKFYNYPKSLSTEDYDRCQAKVLEQLIEFYPRSTIYKVGGKEINPGISDLDFLIVNEEAINGNLLYLRNFSRAHYRSDILIHEAFAIDTFTYQWISRLTSYSLELIYSKDEDGNAELSILPTNKYYEVIKLAYYIVANYPMNFNEYRSTGSIDVKRTISKLKKVLKIESIFREIYNTEVKLIEDDARSQLIDLPNNHQLYSREKVAATLETLLEQTDDTVNRIFENFVELARKTFNQTFSDNFLNFKNYKIVFSDEWKTHIYNDGVYYLPPSLSIINLMFTGINDKFLKQIEFGNIELDISEGDSISNSINSYLNYCDNSNILNLIFDINFSVRGHNSLQYNFYRVLSGIKSSVLSLR